MTDLSCNNMATENDENGADIHSESTYSLARQKLESLLNKNMRIRMTDGRTLVGLFLCTDRDCNVILGSAQEFLKSTVTFESASQSLKFLQRSAIFYDPFRQNFRSTRSLKESHGF